MDLFRRVLNRLRQNRRETEFASDWLDLSQRENLVKGTLLISELERNIRLVEEALGNSMDLNLVRFNAGPEAVPGAALFIDGMVNNRSVEEMLRAVKIDLLGSGLKKTGRGTIFDTVRDTLITNVEVKEAAELERLIVHITRGETALLFDGTARVMLCDTRGWAMRAIAEPEAEMVIRGPREGFVESLQVNTAMLRRRIHSPQLWIQEVEIGELTRTRVGVAYIKGLAR